MLCLYVLFKRFNIQISCFSFQLNMGVLVNSIYQNKAFLENLIILTSVLQIYTVCEGFRCEGYVFSVLKLVPNTNILLFSLRCTFSFCLNELNDHCIVFVYLFFHCEIPTELLANRNSIVF